MSMAISFLAMGMEDERDEGNVIRGDRSLLQDTVFCKFVRMMGQEEMH